MLMGWHFPSDLFQQGQSVIEKVFTLRKKKNVTRAVKLKGTAVGLNNNNDR